ncbi:MAG: type VI secretion system ImpA family N-terminal domain-containing protein [Pseudomonadota bacterium]
MADINLATITDPISDEQPCGPDLDMEFDMDFMNFIAEIEGMIPTRYFSFDPATLSFDTYYGQIGDFLERTRDIRILVPLAKLRILQGDLPGFTETLEVIHRLLKERWIDVHPQPGDFLELSMGQLSTLDDMPNVVLPLQHAPIYRSRRAGPITLRKWQIAQGEVNPREGEDPVDTSTVMGALSEADSDELGGVLETLGRARDAVSGIRFVCIEEAGFDQAPAMEKLPQAIEALIALIESSTGTSASGEAVADGSDADAGGAAAGATAMVVQLPAGSVANREEAVEALHAAAKYFALKEPSSPVPVLLREAQSATAKSFYELVNELVPDNANSAFVSLGQEPWFDVSLYTLDSRNPAPDYENDAPADEEATSSWENAGLDDEIVSENDLPDDAAASGESDGEAAPDESTVDGTLEEARSEDAGPDDATTSDDSANDDVAEDVPAEAEPEEEPFDLFADNNTTDDSGDDGTDSTEEAATGAPVFVANSRPEAVALMEKVLAYYRVAEPSSPVPLMLERAIDLSSKSFIELLGKVLPEGSLKVRPQEGDSGSSW